MISKALSIYFGICLTAIFTYDLTKNNSSWYVPFFFILGLILTLTISDLFEEDKK